MFVFRWPPAITGQRKARAENVNTTPSAPCPPPPELLCDGHTSTAHISGSSLASLHLNSISPILFPVRMAGSTSASTGQHSPAFLGKGKSKLLTHKHTLRITEAKTTAERNPDPTPTSASPLSQLTPAPVYCLGSLPSLSNLAREALSPPC